MNKRILKKYWKWFQVVILIYLVLGVGLYFTQSLIIFHPKKLPVEYTYSFNVPFREVNVPVTAKKNINIIQFVVPDSVSKGIVLFFHGNRGNINRYASYSSYFTKNGYEVWMIDYPGYGKSTGKRTEKILYDDALVMYKMAIDKVPVEKIIIYGKSLGTGIASQLASVRDCKQLILETPYYSMAKLAAEYFFIYPVKPFIKYELPTYKFLEYIKAPVTIFHGTKDGLIPIEHSYWLKNKYPHINLVQIENGRHNNLAGFRIFHENLDSILRQ